MLLFLEKEEKRVMRGGAKTAPPEVSRGIRGAMRKRILEDMVAKVDGTFKVMICDRAATEVLNSALRMHDLVENGVTLVENMANVRQPLPKSPAIYFISPSVDSVRGVIQDWATKDMYESANISQPWEGRISGGYEAPQGAYVYVIIVKDNKGVEHEYTGTVTLLR